MSHFWSTDYLDLTDSLNEEIWERSPGIQKTIQHPKDLGFPGAIGAQQAMLHTGITENDVLPWVPDLVGKQWQERESLIIVGSAYAGFICEYSKRSRAMPLSTYVNAKSSAEFQREFVRCVVSADNNSLDRDYYAKLATLASSWGDASQITLLDLCRASFVKRGAGPANRRGDDGGDKVIRRDSTSQASTHDLASSNIFTRYVDNGSDWTWQRLVNSQAYRIVALGIIAEYGLLRLFHEKGKGLHIYERGNPSMFWTPRHGAGWPAHYASPHSLGYWLCEQKWWVITGQVEGVERSWNLLPVYHPARAYVSKHDPQYQYSRSLLETIR